MEFLAWPRIKDEPPKMIVPALRRVGCYLLIVFEGTPFLIWFTFLLLRLGGTPLPRVLILREWFPGAFEVRGIILSNFENTTFMLSLPLSSEC